MLLPHAAVSTGALNGTISLLQVLAQRFGSGASAEGPNDGQVDAQLELEGWVALSVLVWYGDELRGVLDGLLRNAAVPSSAPVRQISFACELLDVSDESVPSPLQHEIGHLRVQRRELAVLVAGATGCCEPLDTSAE